MGSQNYGEDQYQVLSEAQRALPRLYLEHDPPRDHPTEGRHVVDDPSVLLVHVTHFNALMWNSGNTPCWVIEHGVMVLPNVQYNGGLERGVVVVNNLPSRGRRAGLDVFERVRRWVPLDLVGMGSEALGGLGDVLPAELPALLADYRFLFNPIRYTSLGLAVCEAMAIGLPIIGLATTEMPMVVASGVSGYVDTNVDRLVQRMRGLLADRTEAGRLGEQAREYALHRFDIHRFLREWDAAFADALRLQPSAQVAA